MTSQAFYPHAVSHALQLTIESTEPVVGMDTNSRYVRLWEEPSESWHLVAELTVPEGLATNVVPVSEADDPPLGVVVVWRSNTSRRRMIQTIPWTTGTTTFEHDLVRKEWTGLVTAQAMVVRVSTGTPEPGFASDEHSVVAVGKPVRIDVDEPVRLPGDALKIEWRDFIEDPPVAHAEPEDLFALRKIGYEPPVLFLNQSFDRALDVLGSTGTHGHRARARDATFQMIAHQVWSSVLGAVLGELSDSLDAGHEVEEAIESLDPWMPAVLRDWAGWLMPEADSSTALQDLCERVATGNWENLLVDRLPLAIQHRFETWGGLAGLVKENQL